MPEAPPDGLGLEARKGQSRSAQGPNRVDMPEVQGASVMKVLWVVEELVGDVWFLVDAHLTRSIARESSALHRECFGCKTRIVRFIREAA